MAAIIKLFIFALFALSYTILQPVYSEANQECISSGWKSADGDSINANTIGFQILAQNARGASLTTKIVAKNEADDNPDFNIPACWNEPPYTIILNSNDLKWTTFNHEVDIQGVLEAHSFGALCNRARYNVTLSTGARYFAKGGMTWSESLIMNGGTVSGISSNDSSVQNTQHIVEKGIMVNESSRFDSTSFIISDLNKAQNLPSLSVSNGKTLTVNSSKLVWMVDTGDVMVDDSVLKFEGANTMETTGDFNVAGSQAKVEFAAGTHDISTNSTSIKLTSSSTLSTMASSTVNAENVTVDSSSSTQINVAGTLKVKSMMSNGAAAITGSLHSENVTVGSTGTMSVPLTGSVFVSDTVTNVGVAGVAGTIHAKEFMNDDSAAVFKGNSIVTGGFQNKGNITHGATYNTVINATTFTNQGKIVTKITGTTSSVTINATGTVDLGGTLYLEIDEDSLLPDTTVTICSFGDKTANEFNLLNADGSAFDNNNCKYQTSYSTGLFALLVLPEANCNPPTGGPVNPNAPPVAGPTGGPVNPNAPPTTPTGGPVDPNAPPEPTNSQVPGEGISQQNLIIAIVVPVAAVIVIIVAVLGIKFKPCQKRVAPYRGTTM